MGDPWSDIPNSAAHGVRCLPFQWSRAEITAKVAQVFSVSLAEDSLTNNFQFPDFESQTTPTQSAHMWSLREIESGINVGLYYPSLAPEVFSDNTTFDAWSLRMQGRLDEWYQAVRQSVSLTEKIEFHELLFQIQVLRLNKPSPHCPTPTKASQKRAIKASIALIKEFHILNRLGKMFMLWHAAHCLLEAGTYLLSSVLIGIETKDQDRRQIGGEDTNILVRYIRTVPGLIWKIARRWPSIVHHASVGEAISDSILKNRQKWSEGQDLCGSDLASLREKLGQLTLFPLSPSEEQAPINITSQASELNQSQSFDTLSYPQGQAYPMSGPFNSQLPANETVVPLNTSWPGTQPSLDQSFSVFPDTFDLDYGDPMALDFSGLDSEDIFAALLEGGQSDPLVFQ